MMTREQHLYEAGNALVEALWAHQISLPPEVTQAVDRLARATSAYTVDQEPNSTRLVEGACHEEN